MNSPGAVKISIITPMYNEEPNVERFCQRLFAALEPLPESWEVVCVNDGSTDETLELLLSQKRLCKSMRVVNLARNFGQHAAIIAGFSHCRGEWIITLDADLQNSPEDIPQLIEAFRQGHDLIGTIRMGRQDPYFRKTASRLTNWIIQRISGIHLEDFGCMLRGYHRHVVEGILQHAEQRTFIPALGTLFARNPVEIPVQHDAREAGKSKYSLLKLLVLLLDLMTGFSVWPLRALFFLGMVIAGMGLFMGALIFVLRLYYGSAWAVEGVFTLFALLFFFVGAQFLAFGLLGEYIGRIFQVVRKRPPYVVRELHFEEEVHATALRATDGRGGS